ncbi:MAG: SIS domain-containing protein, partial [Janthinobacterium lividum]
MTAALALSPVDHVEVARSVLAAEAAGLRALAASLDHRFATAVERLAACTGRVVVSGMGKSGHVGRKIASTLASTGTPALFVHPGEASHGDLGMIVPGDAVLALS